jgi:hypothetical protein
MGREKDLDLTTEITEGEKNYTKISYHIRVFYFPTDAQESCFKNIKIYIKTAPTCFGLIIIIRERII